MNPPTMRELCEKATKGPYSAHPKTPVYHSGYRHVIISGNNAEHILSTAHGKYLDQTKANASLHARLDPDTVLKVLDALEAYRDEQQGFADQIISPRKLKDEYQAKVNSITRIFNLLNGITTEKTPGTQ